jgi:membrane protein
MKRVEKLLLLAGLMSMGLSVAASERRPAPAGNSGNGTGDHAPAGAERGRYADAPSQIPPRGWWDIARRVAVQFGDHRIMTEAAGITFYVLLSLFPALAALISIYGLFADPNTVSRQLDTLKGLVPGGGLQLIGEQAHALASKGGGALGFGVLIGLATSLWSSNQAMKSLFDALNVVYDEHEKRGYILRTAISLGFTAATLLFLVVAMAAVVALPVALDVVGLGFTADLLLRLLRWPVLLLMVAVFLAFVYRYGPSRTRARWRWVSWGGVMAAVLWVVASAGFSWYVASFGSYNKTYGSLGAVVGFMTWIWISAMVVLTGGEVDAEMEHQTVRDTTIPPRRPLGQRGAVKADTVAVEAGG